jgi:hypothetical protein
VCGVADTTGQAARLRECWLVAGSRKKWVLDGEVGRRPDQVSGGGP